MTSISSRQVRYTRPKIPLNERKCIFCNKNSVEDEIHFLLDCDFYSDLRYALTENACILFENFENLILEDKFLFIMTNEILFAITCILINHKYFRYVVYILTVSHLISHMWLGTNIIIDTILLCTFLIVLNMYRCMKCFILVCDTIIK